MTYILSLLRSLVRHLIRRRYLTTDMPPKYRGEKSHIYMTIVAPSEGCIVYVATVNFPTNLIKLAAATCEIIAVLRIKWRGLVNYFDVNLGGRDLLLSEIDHQGTLPTRVFTPPFAVPYSMAQTLKRNVELYIGAGQFYIIQMLQSSGTPGVYDTDRMPVSGSHFSLSDPENPTTWP